jgi:hypothetical protein
VQSRVFEATLHKRHKEWTVIPSGNWDAGCSWEIRGKSGGNPGQTDIYRF